MLDRADYILFCLATVLGLWGVSLVWRGVRRGRTSIARRCPSCRVAMADAASMKCSHCAYESDRGKDFRVRTVHWPLTIGGGFTVLAAVGTWIAATIVAEWGYRSGDVPDISPGWGAAGWGCVAFGLVAAISGCIGKSSGGKRHCPKCWYDMQALPGTRCPECGHEAKLARLLYKRRRRPVRAAVGVLVVALGVALMLTPVVKRGGWVRLVPASALIAAIEFAPDEIPSRPSRVQGLANELLLRREAGLWDWQEAWLSGACARICRSSDVRGRLSAVAILQPGDAVVADILVLRALTALDGKDQRELDISMNALHMVDDWSYVWSHPNWKYLAKAKADRILKLLATERSPTCVGLTFLLLCDQPPEEDVIRGLVNVASARPLSQTAAHADAIYRTYQTHPRQTQQFLSRMLEEGTPSRRRFCLSALTGWYWGLAYLFEGNRTADDPDSLCRELFQTMKAFDTLIGSQINYRAMLTVSRKVRGEIWDDLVLPRLVWVDSALASAQATHRETACHTLAAVARYTSIPLDAFRPRLEALAAEGSAPAKDALRALDGRRP